MANDIQGSGIISMDAATQKVVSDSQNVVPKDQDEETVRLVLDLFEQGRQARAQVDSDWPKRWAFYSGIQWDKQRPSYKSKPVLNIIRQTIQGMLPLLTDNRPGFNVIPQEPSDYGFSKILSDLVESWWDKTSMDHTLVEWLMDCMIFDAGILKVVWDSSAEDNAGDVAVSVVSPMDLYVPYGCRDFIKECGWVLQRCIKTVGELRAQFPDKLNLIKNDSPEQATPNPSMLASSYQNVATDAVLVSPVDKKANNSQAFPVAQPDMRKTCVVYELWLDDDTMEQIEMENDDGVKETVNKKKWPNGRLITILPNQKILLQDTHNPYKHRRKPFVRLVDKILPRQFWGEGQCKILMDQQRIINKIMANVVDYSNLMANPTWITEAGNGVDPERITNSYAAIIQTLAGKSGTVRRDIPPGMQSGMVELLQFMLKQSEAISGSSDVSQGRTPAGVTAAAAISSLQEAAQTQIRGIERGMGTSLGQFGYLVISLMMQYYGEPRVARLTNKQEQWPKFFEFFFENNPDGSGTWNKRDHTFDGQQYQPGEWQSGQTKGTMDVRVLSGTSLPFAKTQRANVAFRLFDSKAIDVEELLDALEWPNKEKLLERLRAEGIVPPEAGAEPTGQAAPQGGPPPGPPQGPPGMLPAGPANGGGAVPPAGAGIVQGPQ
jgi:hypothetical protein